MINYDQHLGYLSTFCTLVFAHSCQRLIGSLHIACHRCMVVDAFRKVVICLMDTLRQSHALTASAALVTLGDASIKRKMSSNLVAFACFLQLILDSQPFETKFMSLHTKSVYSTAL